MIRYAMFDYGNVLVHFDTLKFYDFLRTHQRLGSRDVKGIFRNLDCLSEFDLGRIKVDEMFNGVKEALGLDVKKSDFLFAYTEVIKPDHKMVSIKKILRENSVNLAVVSNINSYHYHYVQLVHPEVFSGFDYLMLSFQHGFKKPDPRMWDVPAEQLSIRPEECFFIDDLEENIAAFERWGGIGHHYDVIDEKYCPNGRLEIERNRLLVRMTQLGMLSPAQASSIAQVTF